MVEMTTQQEQALWRTVIRSCRPHQHRGFRCRCRFWCDAIETVLDQIARLAPDDYQWLKEHVTGFSPMPRARTRALPEAAPTGGDVLGAAVIPARQRLFRRASGRDDAYQVRPISGRVELAIERCPIDTKLRLWVVAHELGHLHDLVDRVTAVDVAQFNVPDDGYEASERKADAYALRWGFEQP